MIDRIDDYGEKARVLRQIMSNKARRYKFVNSMQTLLTVVLSSLLTFLAFAGNQKVQSYLGWHSPDDPLRMEILLNAIVFALFVLLLLHLVFHFTRKQAEAERAVVSLTTLINYVDDLVARAQRGHDVGAEQLDLIRQKYETLIEVIPANSDREYKKARIDTQKKAIAKGEPVAGVREIFSKDQQRRLLEAIIRQSPQLMSLLDAVRRVDERLYLGGGPVRNAVWDYLHGHATPTPLDDVDVMYFDQLNSRKEHDIALEEQLRRRLQNQTWSVKNQARMHASNDEPAYASLEDAVSKWPETATAVVARLTSDNAIEIIAPHGLTDLFRLVVAPTPHFEQRLDRYRERLARKRWWQTWPNLRFVAYER